MKRILEQIAEINAANKAGKRKLVLEYMQGKDFNRFMRYCLDDSLTFNATRVAATTPIEGDFYDKLDELNLKGSASKADKEELASLGSQSPEHLEVLNKILRKNPDCGFSAKSLHAILPGEIAYYPYQRCSTDKELDRIFNTPTSSGEHYAFSELKENGLFIRIKIPTGGKPIFESRNGKVFDFGDQFDANFLALDPGMLDVDGADFEMFESGVVFEGEALVLREKVVDGVYPWLPRTTGNGITNKFQGGYGSQEELSRIGFSIWNCLPYNDCIDGYNPLTVEQRRECVAQLIDAATIDYDIIHQTETKKVFSKDAAWDHYYEIRSRPVPEGEEPLEGAVWKHADEVWRDGTSLLMAKGKSVKECEVEIFGWEKGKPGGKYENVLGSLHIRSSCGGLVGKCSGMTDAMRNEDPETFVGKICTVKFNAVSQSEDARKARSFDHARFVECRPDKVVADDLEYILKVKSKKR
jgi:hypothetical protein